MQAMNYQKCAALWRRWASAARFHPPKGLASAPARRLQRTNSPEDAMQATRHSIVAATAALLAMTAVHGFACGLPPGTSSAAAAAALLAVSATHAQATDAPEADALYHRFAIPTRLSWGEVRVPLSPEAWRVGHPGGPPASEAQLSAALADAAGIEIGARCTGWVEGATVYPCGFALRDFGFAGSAGERFAGIAVDLEQPDADARRRSLGRRRELEAAGLIAPVLDAPRFVAVRVPPRYLERNGAFGTTITFGFRAVSNPLVPSLFDREGGATVILRGGQPSSPAPDSISHAEATNSIR